MKRNSIVAAMVVLTGLCAATQCQQPDMIRGDEAIDRALRLSSLTQGAVQFHAVLKISGPSSQYSGTVDVLWLGPAQYRLTITSPDFHQVKIVNGTQTSEVNEGDYSPRWLQNFVEAILDPLPAANFRNPRSTISIGENMRTSCLQRDDRPGGVTDQTTWGMLCFRGTDPLPESVLTFNRSLSFSDFRSFGKQKIARAYKTDVLDYKEVTGHLSVLENPKDTNPAQVAIQTPTLAPLTTALVSTLKEESLLERAPKIEWPSVHEGRTDGYMIIYARTDRAGQVRETAKHNSDQPGLEQFGMEQALRYKFHPLLVDGFPQQMEMPLVLHFTSRSDDPLSILTDEQMRKQTHGCSLPALKPGAASYRIKLSVNEQGKLTGETFPDANTPGYVGPTHFFSFQSCRFDPYLVNGKASYYHGMLTLPR